MTVKAVIMKTIKSCDSRFRFDSRRDHKDDRPSRACNPDLKPTPKPEMPSSGSGRQRGAPGSVSTSPSSFDRDPLLQSARGSPSSTTRHRRTVRLRLLFFVAAIVLVLVHRSLWRAIQAIPTASVPLLLEKQKATSQKRLPAKPIDSRTRQKNETKQLSTTQTERREKAKIVASSATTKEKVEPVVKVVSKPIHTATVTAAQNATKAAIARPVTINPPTKQSANVTNPQATIDDRLNIVLLYADDWTYRMLGMVNKLVHTPNLNAMAKRGMFFKRNCVTSSICWQSRANMFTGTTTSVHGAFKIVDDKFLRNDSAVYWEETLYPLMKRAGYHRGYIGKFHNAMPFDNLTKLADWTSLYFRHHWETRNGKLRHVTDLNREDALRYLREIRPPDQNFFLTVAFYATHAQEAMPPERQFEHQNYTSHLYEHVTIPTPKTATEQHWKDMPYFFTEQNEGRKRWAKRFKTPEMFQMSMKNLYRMSTEFDDVVGTIVDELKQQGLENKTLVIFTTDNGVFLSHHGLADKWYPHEESVRVPLIVFDPRMPEHSRGQLNEELTLSVDLAPTMLTAAGIKAPAFMQGRDIAQLYLNPKEAANTWRQDYFYEWNLGNPHNASGHELPQYLPAVFALIQKDYKYFYWPQLQYEQVFNLKDDPFEERDIFNWTAQNDLPKLQSLRERYQQLKASTQSGHPV